MMRRFVTVTLLAAMLCTLSVAPALAQVFPSKIVSIVVPNPPGAITDILARALANELGKFWGKPVVVENVSGAAMIIGSKKVANAQPSGHTLLLSVDSAVVSNRFLYKELPFDPDKGLTPIMMIARSAQLVLANESFAANNVRELVEAARRAPQRVAYATPGAGTPAHLLFAALGEQEGVQLLHVPYNGIAPAMTATMTGETQVTLAAYGAAASALKGGKVKALAIGGLQRSSLFPNIPTLAELGFSKIRCEIWWGLFTTGGTSEQIVDRINHDVTSVVRRPDFINKYLTAFGLDLVADTPAEFAAAIRADVKATAEMVKAAGVKPQ